MSIVVSLQNQVPDQLSFEFLHSHSGRGIAITPRQMECLTWAQEGKSATDIGAILGISARTVEGHLARVCEQLGVRTRIQAVVKAMDLGLLGGSVE